MPRRRNRVMKRISQLLVIVLVFPFAAGAQTGHWITTWTTSQQLLAPHVTAARACGRANNLPSSCVDQTVRMIAHVSVGGRRIRVEFSNRLNAPPVEIGAAH